MKGLSHRARQVLATVVAGYITTAEPVGSKAVSQSSGLDVSPATIRNVMAELVEMGYLSQPHVSAGRVPTAQGVRFYVDSILEVRELTDREKAMIQKRLQTDSMDSRDLKDVSEVLKATGKALSDLSQQVAVVATPGPDQEVFRHIEFILLKPGLILVVLVSKSGAVHNRIIEAEKDLSQDDLNKYTNYLNDLLADLNLNEVKAKVAKEMAQEKVKFDRILTGALSLGEKALDGQPSGEIFVEGQSNLLVAPDFADVLQLKQVFLAFEEKTILLRLLEKSHLAQGVQIFVGADSELAGLEGLTAVTTSYGGGKSPVGSLGVVGPTRMDYSRVIPIVDYTAKLVSRMLNKR